MKDLAKILRRPRKCQAKMQEAQAKMRSHRG